MPTPSDKSEQVNDALYKLFGVDRIETIRANLCAWCKTPNFNWKDELSKKEYTISGMCQDCQDTVYEDSK